MNNIQWHLGSSSSAQLQILQSCKKITTMNENFLCSDASVILSAEYVSGYRWMFTLARRCALPIDQDWMKCTYYYIFFSNLFVSLLFTQDRNPKVLGLGPQGPECKLNPYWSKLRVREKHDVMLFSFLTCPLIPKTLLTQKSDSIFVHRLLRYSIFPHI